jgi:uncharacterized phage protein (TIGR01671 family)
MRTIKFRAWDKITRSWYQNCQNSDDLIMINPIVNPKITGEFYLQDSSSSGKDVLEYSQFTGLIDKNSKEIYEGDILNSDKAVKFRVIYDDSKARFSFVCKNIWGGSRSNVYKSASWIVKNCTVFGNIYENPELL